MDKWINSLSNKELKTWIKNMDNPLGQFLASNEDIKNLELAKNIYNKRVYKH